MISTDFQRETPTATATTSAAANLHSDTGHDDLTGDAVCSAKHTAIPNVNCSGRAEASSSSRNSYSSGSRHASASHPVVA